MLTFDFKKINLPPRSKVLDVGCGEGRHIFGILNEFENVYCYGLDQDIPSLDKCKEGLEFFKELDSNGTIFQEGSVYQLPFEENFFDLIICSEVLEHLDDYHAAIKEIHRVLKPGGKFLPSVPSYWPEKICWLLSTEYQNMPGGHVRIFRHSQLKKLALDNGLEYKSFHWAHGLHSPYWWLQCLFWSRKEKSYTVKLYHRFLVWDLMQNPLLTRILEAILQPLIGKSLVMYFRKPT